MFKTKYLFLILFVAFFSCAKRGSITGGSKDTIAPILKMSFPQDKSLNFKGNEIKLVFNEYIKLKDIAKQLIISPPMKKMPEITPSVASKEIHIKIKDTLQPNTTYSFNFGQSIQDNNEGNAFRQFKYIFSTGSHLDSLTLKGTIKDALEKKSDNFVSVMLYEVNQKYSDSAIFKQNPRYITNTLDSAKSFKLENLKAGKYRLVALKDENNNYRFNPEKEKIGFYQKEITIPNDSSFELKLFKEKLKFKTERPLIAASNRLLLPYYGNPKNAKIVLKNKDQVLPTIITKFPEKDSLQLWFQPIKTDSLSINISNENYSKSYKIKYKEAKKDSLFIKQVSQDVLSFRENYTIHSSIPLTKFDKSKMMLTNKDSVAVAFETAYDEYKQELKFLFKQEPLEKYKLKIQKGALITYLEKPNDSLLYKFTTKNTTDYGNLKVVLQNVKRFPIILQLKDSNGKVKETAYSERETTIDFNLIEPEKYSLRLIYDDNKNKEWDTGNYLEKKQAEAVIYFSKPVDVRSNWDVEQGFDVGQ